MVPHFWPQMTCILRICNISRDKNQYLKLAHKQWKELESFGRCLSSPETRTTSSCSAERRTCALSVFLFKATWLRVPFPSCLFTPFPSLRVHLPWPALVPASSWPQHMTTASAFPEDNPSVNRTLSSLTQSGPRSWISRRKNPSDSGLPLGYGSAVIFLSGPIISGHREPDYTKGSRQMSPLLCERRRFQDPQKVKNSIHQLRPTWLNFSNHHKGSGVSGREQRVQSWRGG